MTQIAKLFFISFLLMLSTIVAQVGKTEKCNSKPKRMDKMELGFNKLDRIARMQKVLNLTDDQKQKTIDLKFEHEKNELDLKNEIANNNLVIRKMMTDNNINENQLLELVKNNSELKSKIKVSKTQLWLSVYKMLNDDQKTKWIKTFGHNLGKNRKSKQMPKNRSHNRRFDR